MSAPRRTVARLASFVGLVALMSCRRREERVTKDEIVSPPLDASPPDAKTTSPLEGLKFEDDVTGPRLLQLEACAQRIAADGGRATAWEKYGNFFGAKWCRGKGAREDCQITGGTEYEHDQLINTLETMFYDGQPHFGLSIGARWIPPDTGWAIDLFFSENGKTIFGNGFGLTFRHFTTAEPNPESSVYAAPSSLSVVLGDAYAYRIFEENVTVGASKLPLRAEFQRYLGSAEALRDAGLDLLSRARTEVNGRLTTHKATVLVFGKPPRPGLPPETTPRPATAAEEATELAKAKVHFDAKESLLRASHVEMYAVLLRAFPFDRCWK